MAISRWYSTSCDTCGTTHSAVLPSVNESRAVAKADGWTVAVPNVCPEHGRR